MSGLIRSSCCCCLAMWLASVVSGQDAEPVQPTPPTKPDVCRAVEIDKDRFIFSEVEFDAPVRGEGQNPSEFEAYNEVVMFARRQELDKMLKCARRDVTFKDLLPRLDDKTGELIHPGKDFQYDLLFFEGRLLRLRDIKPTKPLVGAGLTGLYEGWMFPKNGADPMCILISELPPGLEPGLDYSPTKPVSVVGYFFKLIQYESVEPNPKNPNRGKVRRAPLLIGKTLILGPQPNQNDEGSNDIELLLGWFGIVTVVGGGLLGLVWLYRSGDKKHREAMETRRDNNPFDPGRTVE